MDEASREAPDAPASQRGDRNAPQGFARRAAWTLLLVAIGGVSFLALTDSTGPGGAAALKGWGVVALAVVLIAGIWIPPFGRALARVFKRGG